MDTDDTSAVDPTWRCSLCHRILFSQIETRRALESTRICNNCNVLFLEDTVTTQTRYDNSLDSVENMLSQQAPDLQPTISDHVNLNNDDDEDGVNENDNNNNNDVDDEDDNNNNDVNDNDDDNGGGGETDRVENSVQRLMDRIQLHRSLATNGRNRPIDWLGDILSDEGVRNSERGQLFGILEDQVIETSGYIETRISRLGAPPAASWFVKNIDRARVDDPGLVCVICKDSMRVGSIVNRLPCGHVYHPSCIVPWLNARNTCPLCRYELPSNSNDRSREIREVHGALGESGGGRWWFVVAPLVSVMGVVVVFWLGDGLFGGQRDDRSTRWGLF